VNNDWLDIDVLEDYLDGKLDAKAMHFVERQALEDPFVAEALEGLKQSPKRKQSLSILQKQLYDRVAQKPVKRKLWGITTQRLSIAATATVAFIAVSILFFMRETNRRNEIAQRKSKGVIVNLDTNTALATTKPADGLKSDSPNTKSTLIDGALSKAKTSDLAVNKKSETFRMSASVPVARGASEQVVFSAKRSAPVADIHSEKAIVNAAAPIATSNLVYSGNVVAQSDGHPVKGAVVKLAGSNQATATDANGNFKLPVDSSQANRDITVNAIGFKDVSIQGTIDPNVLKSALTSGRSASEIAAMTGSNGRKKEAIPIPKVVLRAEQNLDKSLGEITKPVPVSTVDFESYLESNNKLYNPAGPEQYVILSFKVKKNGRPGNISIVKSLNKKADAEAKRLIETGPDWVLPKNGVTQVELSVKF